MSCKSHKCFIIVKIQGGEVGKSIKRTIHPIDLKFWILGTALYFTAKFNLLLSVKCKMKVKVNTLKAVFKSQLSCTEEGTINIFQLCFFLVLFENFNSLSKQYLCMAWQTWPLLAKHQIPHANILSITKKYQQRTFWWVSTNTWCLKHSDVNKVISASYFKIWIQDLIKTQAHAT